MDRANQAKVWKLFWSFPIQQQHTEHSDPTMSGLQTFCCLIPMQPPHLVSLQGRAAWLSGPAACEATIYQLSPSDCRSLGEAAQGAVELPGGPGPEGSVLLLSGWCQGSGWSRMMSRRPGFGWGSGWWWWFGSAVPATWWGEDAGWCSRGESVWSSCDS